MPDQDLPEPSHAGSGRGKQIVFLFMSAVVVAVVIFLLGVSVGRGVRQNTDALAAAQNTAPADPAAATAAPPGQAAPGDLKYHDSLRSGAPPSPPAGDQTASAPAPDPSPSTPPPAVNESAPSTPAKETRTSKAPTTATASGKRGEYFVQVGAYRTLNAAQNVVKQVKGADSGYSVSTVTMPESAPPPRFKVVVGPYATADDARAVIARLKKQGFDPFLKR